MKEKQPQKNSEARKPKNKTVTNQVARNAFRLNVQNKTRVKNPKYKQYKASFSKIGIEVYEQKRPSLNETFSNFVRNNNKKIIIISLWLIIFFNAGLIVGTEVQNDLGEELYFTKIIREDNETIRDNFTTVGIYLDRTHSMFIDERLSYELFVHTFWHEYVHHRVNVDDDLQMYEELLKEHFSKKNVHNISQYSYYSNDWEETLAEVAASIQACNVSLNLSPIQKDLLNKTIPGHQQSKCYKEVIQ